MPSKQLLEKHSYETIGGEPKWKEGGVCTIIPNWLKVPPSFVVLGGGAGGVWPRGHLKAMINE